MGMPDSARSYTGNKAVQITEKVHFQKILTAQPRDEEKELASHKVQLFSVGAAPIEIDPAIQKEVVSQKSNGCATC